MLFQPLHDLGVGFLNTAQIPAETILIQLFVRLAVPQAAGVKADLVGQNNGAVSQAAKLQLEVNQRHAAGLPEALKDLVDLESVLFDGIQLLGGTQLQGQGMVTVQQLIAQLFIFII